jgi:hypothetical protein
MQPPPKHPQLTVAAQAALNESWNEFARWTARPDWRATFHLGWAICIELAALREAIVRHDGARG